MWRVFFYFRVFIIVILLYDFFPNFKLEVFSPLKDYTLFKNVQVDLGGYGISWNDELDLSESDLWIKGIEVKNETVQMNN